jgi:hypothetical protein
LSKIALDEGAPEEIALHLPGHRVQSVRQLGLKGTKNGRLLAAIEAGGFDVFISNDKRLEFDQNVALWPFAFLLLSTNHWPTIDPPVANVAKALETAKPGTVTKVDCGTFVKRKFRRPDI